MAARNGIAARPRRLSGPGRARCSSGAQPAAACAQSSLPPSTAAGSVERAAASTAAAGSAVSMAGVAASTAAGAAAGSWRSPGSAPSSRRAVGGVAAAGGDGGGERGGEPGGARRGLEQQPCADRRRSPSMRAAAYVIALALRPRAGGRPASECTKFSIRITRPGVAARLNSTKDFKKPVRAAPGT
jgi:hypothetical protein